MAKTYRQRKGRKWNTLITLATALLISVVFLSVVLSFYTNVEEEAFEALHVQTKEIKDDLILQLKSDRENLVTMANFASKLFADGEDYSIMLDAFKPIGLFSGIGILSPDGTFSTLKGTIDLGDKISFEEEAARGEYISGRVPDLTREGREIIRSAVPIKSGGEVVGVLYGVIQLDVIRDKYEAMAREIDAQLFVYNKKTGRFLIDTINENPAELSELKNREYNEGYSFEQFLTTDNGFTAFKSKFSDENLYIHYSTIEEFDWGIILGRYENSVFAEAHKISSRLVTSFALMVLIIVVYLQVVLGAERRVSKLQQKSSEIRKLLLEVNQQNSSITDALKQIKEFTSSRSAFFNDTDGEDYFYIKPSLENKLLTGVDRRYFQAELFSYASSLTGLSGVVIMKIIPNAHLRKTNEAFYNFFKEHSIKSVVFAIIADKNNQVGILGILNPKKTTPARMLLEDVAVCFSIALYNKKHLNRTETLAITDSLTGVFNRVSYNNDAQAFDAEAPDDFACIYFDVNELHMRNNKYGHAAGDEMLIYIANTLKEVFFGHFVYRMGGDEFLVFTKGIKLDEVNEKLVLFEAQISAVGYNVSVGLSYRTRCTSCDEMVREAEVRMYEDKARYYQKKQESADKGEDHSYLQVKTGIVEIDTMISVLKEHYNGIYKVSLKEDKAHRILMPSYLGYDEDEDNFSRLISRYIDETVHADFRRSVVGFLNYDAIKKSLLEGKSPSITYKKTNGDTVILTVYKLDEKSESANDVLFVFAKD